LALYDVTLYLVSPELLRARKEVVEHAKKRIRVVEEKNVGDIIPKLDVLYVTRIQKERFPDPEEYEKVRGSYRITLDTVRHAKNSLAILHPLPRVDEVAPEVDSTSYAKYFKEVWYGLAVRMGILALVLGAV